MSSESLRIGWATASITPDQPVQLSGQHHERVSQSVHDPCTATAMAIQSNVPGQAGQAILLSCDLVNVGRSKVLAVRERVGGVLGDFDPHNLMVCATHTHTGPTLRAGQYPVPGPGVMRPEEYAAFFVERAADAAVRAWQARKPAGVSWALGHAVLGFNRRTAYRDGTSRMYGPSDDDAFIGMEGGMDPGAELLFTWDAAGELTGAIVNIACPSQVVESELFVSADFWHPARQQIRQRLGQGVSVLPMCGAAGDQSPRDLVRRNRGEPNMRKLDGMEELGRRLGLAVEDAFRAAQGPIVRDPIFRHATAGLSLPMRKATQQEAQEARRHLAELTRSGQPDPATADGQWVRRCRRVIERYDTQGDDPRYLADVHVMRLGEVALASNPFELYLDYGLQIKARSRARQTFLAQIANDRGLYLPTDRAVAGGSYGAMIYDNIVGPEGGRELVERTVEMINAMWAEA